MPIRKKPISQFPTADSFLVGDYILGIHQGKTSKFPESVINMLGATGPTGNNIYLTDSISASTYSVSFSSQYYGVVYTGGVCTVTLPEGSSPDDDGKFIIIADEQGDIESYGRGITVGGSGGQLIDGKSNVSMKINWISLTFLFRNNSWKII